MRMKKKHGEMFSVKVTQIETVDSSLQDLVGNFNKVVTTFKKHLVLICHQFAQYRLFRGSLLENE